MKKNRILSTCLSLFTIIGVLGNTSLSTGLYAAEATPTGGIYAEYTFGKTQSEDVSRNMTFSSGGEYSDYGYKLKPYTEIKDEVTGKTTKNKSTVGTSINFDVTTAPEGHNDYYVEVEYLNLPKGFFYIKYSDQTGKIKETELVCPAADVDRSKDISEQCEDAAKINETNAGTKKHLFRLSNVDFTKSRDFSIETVREAKSSRFECGDAYTYIKKVSIYREEKLPVTAEIKSDNPGNIFYDSDMAELDVIFSGISDVSSFDADVKIYTLDKNNQWIKQEDLNTDILSSESISKGEKLRKTLIFPIEKYGIYKMELDITANGKTYTAAMAEFSKSVGNDKQNDSFGVNFHYSTWDAGTMRSYAALAKNAGFGISRDGFAWHNYERKGVKLGLSNFDKAQLSICKEFGFEPYVVISPINPYNTIDSQNNGIPDSSAFDGLVKYVEDLLSEPEFADVNNFELCNEPVLNVFWDETEQKLKYGGVTDTEVEEVYTQKGEAYGKVAELMINAIRKVRGDSAKIAILAGCDNDTKFDKNNNRVFWMDKGKSKYFTIGAFDYLSDPNGDGNKSDSLLGKVDVISYHPYSYRTNPEVIRERAVKGVEDIGREFGFNPESSWHTEFGFSTCINPSNVACIGDGYKQALSIIKEYATLYTQNNKDKMFIYDLIDDDIVLNAQESNYGILHSELYDTPYGAKFAYLAVSNLNKMIEDTKNAKFVYNTVDDLYTGDYKTETNGYGEKGEYVAKFTGDDTKKSVYMLWSIEADKEISYKIPENVIGYYDYLGNKIDPKTVETANGYKLSSEPFYAVCGEDILKSNMVKGEIVKASVEGVTFSETENVNVTLLVSDVEAVSIKNLSKEDILYADFYTTDKDGKYFFRFETETTAQVLYCYLLEQDGTESRFEVIPKKNSAELFFYKNMQKLSKNEVSKETVENVYLAAKMGGDTVKYPDASLIFAFYKNGKLINMSTESMNDSVVTQKIVIPEGMEYDEIKIFLWEDMNRLNPLCDNIYID